MPEPPPCTECGAHPSRGAGMAHCSRCAERKRGTSIFARLSAEERRVIRSMAQSTTTTTTEEDV